jgi:hypothetical protein
MNDPMSLARSARENLAHGLAALQSPGVPPQVMSVAEPIAHAMSALHYVETTGGGGLADSAPRALDAVRRALALLQSQPASHPAVNQAMEAIASSLSLIHTLTQSAPPPQAAAFAGTVALNQPMPHGQAPATQPSPAVAAPQYGGYAQQPQPAYQQPNVQSPAAYAATAAQPQFPDGAAYPPPPPAPMPGQWQNPAPAAAAPAQQWQNPAPPAPAPAQQWQNPAPPAPAPAQQWQNPAPPAAAPAQQWQNPAPPPPAPAQAWQPQPPAAPAPSPHRGSQPRGDGAIRVEAELGAHSSTNFYKGLSGNDVIDSGGIFIATYQIPDIGQDVLIRVSMPGGYEFEAVGIVRWTRDMPHSGADAPPGFGAQFTQISPEGRQLVYRYVRNREPLFHDDL